jgi:hypothetical protein
MRSRRENSSEGVGITNGMEQRSASMASFGSSSKVFGGDVSSGLSTSPNESTICDDSGQEEVRWDKILKGNNTTYLDDE